MSLVKEYFRLRRNIDRLTDGQVSVNDVDCDSVRQFRVVVSPNSGLYKGGRIVFRIRLPEDYPDTEQPPDILCETRVLHPNIDSDRVFEEDNDDCDEDDEYNDDEGNVCLNLFCGGVWRSSFGLESIVLGLLFLMHNPNFDSPLMAGFEGMDESERKLAIEKNIEELARVVDDPNKVDVLKSDDTKKTESIEVDFPIASSTADAEIHESGYDSNEIPIEISNVSTTTNEPLVQTENIDGQAETRVSTAEIETVNSIATTASGREIGLHEDVKVIGVESTASTKKDYISKIKEGIEDCDKVSEQNDEHGRIENDVNAVLVANSTTAEETNEDKVYTKLVAFDGDYILFGGTDSEVQGLREA